MGHQFSWEPGCSTQRPSDQMFFTTRQVNSAGPECLAREEWPAETNLMRLAEIIKTEISCKGNEEAISQRMKGGAPAWLEFKCLGSSSRRERDRETEMGRAGVIHGMRRCLRRWCGKAGRSGVRCRVPCQLIRVRGRALVHKRLRLAQTAAPLAAARARVRAFRGSGTEMIQAERRGAELFSLT